jgi:hypothetical protein
MANDDIQAVAPDGSTHVFPAGTSDDVIDRTMKSYISGNSETQQPAQQTPAKSSNQQLTEQRPLAPFDSSHPVSSVVHDVGTELGNVGAGGIASIESMAHPINTAKKMVSGIPEALRAAGTGQGVDPGYAIGSMIPFLGAGELAASSPDIARGIKNAPETMSNLKSSVIDATRDPYTGKLLPRVREGAQLAGAAIGSTAGALAGGNPEAIFGGGYAGYRLAPPLTDLLLPKKPMPPPNEVALGNFMNKGYEPVGEPNSAYQPTQQEQDLGTFMNKNYQSMVPGNPYSPPANTPFEPLVYSSENEPDQIAQRMANLKRQASSAGTYHAAQGSASKTTNLQQRITNRFGAPVEDPYSPTR